MNDASKSATTHLERVSISCPGCGRHDWVSWPAGQSTFHWTCFNCEKTFDLPRPGGGH